MFNSCCQIECHKQTKKLSTKPIATVFYLRKCPKNCVEHIFRIRSSSKVTDASQSLRYKSHVKRLKKDLCKYSYSQDSNRFRIFT